MAFCSSVSARRGGAVIVSGIPQLVTAGALGALAAGAAPPSLRAHPAVTASVTARTDMTTVFMAGKLARLFKVESLRGR
ncbi:hypothetical protein JCM9533A_79820 [Catenuloplanes niger JCM 9533]